MSSPLPRRIVAELERDIDGLANGPLIRFAAARAGDAAGEVSGEPRAAAIRTRLKERLRANGLDADLASLLACHGANRELVAVLSAEALDLFFSELLGLFGRDKILAAMLVDPREAVRGLALRHLESAAGGKLSRREAKEGLARGLAPFLRHVRAFMPERGRSAGTTDKGRRAARPTKKEKALQTKLEAVTREAESCRSRLEREKKACAELRRALREAEGKNAVLRQEWEDAVRLEVHRRMESEVRGWLRSARDLERRAEAAGVGDDGRDVLARIDEALEAQEKTDRHYGNRRRLIRRLRALESGRRRLVEAARTALNPLPGLAALVSDIDREIDEIRRRLGACSSGDPLAERLLLRLNDAADLDELERVAAQVRRLRGDGLLPPAAAADVEERLDALRGRLYDRYRPAPPAGPEILRLMGDKYGGALLLLDGYNIILGLPELFGRDLEEGGRPGAQARERLLAAVDGACRALGAEADVFFDGERAAERGYSPLVREVFSGGGGSEMPDRADLAIIAHLENRLPEAGRREVIVSNDRELRARGLELGAEGMALAELAALLRAIRERG